MVAYEGLMWCYNVNSKAHKCTWTSMSKKKIQKTNWRAFRLTSSPWNKWKPPRQVELRRFWFTRPSVCANEYRRGRLSCGGFCSLDLARVQMKTAAGSWVAAVLSERCHKFWRTCYNKNDFDATSLGTGTHTNTHIHILTHKHTHIHKHIHICLHTHIYIYIYIYTCVCAYIYTHKKKKKYIYIYISLLAPLYMQAYACICAYIVVHTRVRALWPHVWAWKHRFTVLGVKQHRT